MSDRLKNNALMAAAESVLRQADEAQGRYGVPVDPDVADFMGISEIEALDGHEES